MSHKQNARQYRNIKTDYKSFEKVEKFKDFGKTYTNQYCIHEEIKRVTKLSECLLSMSAERLVFQFAIQKYKGYDKQSYNFARCFVWVCSLVSHNEGGT
jgi:hypothetical protein